MIASLPGCAVAPRLTQVLRSGLRTEDAGDRRRAAGKGRRQAMRRAGLLETMASGSGGRDAGGGARYRPGSVERLAGEPRVAEAVERAEHEVGTLFAEVCEADGTLGRWREAVGASFRPASSRVRARGWRPTRVGSGGGVVRVSSTGTGQVGGGSPGLVVGVTRCHRPESRPGGRESSVRGGAARRRPTRSAARVEPTDRRDHAGAEVTGGGPMVRSAADISALAPRRPPVTGPEEVSRQSRSAVLVCAVCGPRRACATCPGLRERATADARRRGLRRRPRLAAYDRA